MGGQEPDKGEWKSSSGSELTTEKGFFSYNHTDQPSVKVYIVQTALFFKVGEVSFDYLPWKGAGGEGRS